MGINIGLARVFIPYPTGFTRTGRTFGLKKFQGWEIAAYKYFKQNGQFDDDVAEYKEFYDVLNSAYGVNLTLPKVAPFVQYVDYVKSIGGGFDVENTRVIEHLKQNCNTLIITDSQEREYVEQLYLNVLRREFCGNEIEPAVIPARFLQKVR